MQYLFLIYGPEQPEGAVSPAEHASLMQEYFAFTEEASAQGILVAGDELKPTTTATTLRPRGQQLITTDGPYAETKEQLGGYYLLECQDLEEAIVWAAKIPGARTGSIEVRPVINFG